MASRADKRLLKSVVDLDLVDFFSDEEFDPADYVKTFYEQRGASQAASRMEKLDVLKRQIDEASRTAAVRNYKAFMHVGEEIRSIETGIQTLKDLLESTGDTLQAFRGVRFAEAAKPSDKATTGGSTSRGAAAVAARRVGGAAGVEEDQVGEVDDRSTSRGLKLPEWLNQAPMELEELLLERRHREAVTLIRRVREFSSNVQNATNLGRGVEKIFQRVETMAGGMAERLLAEISAANTLTVWGFREHKNNFALLIALGHGEKAAVSFIGERSAMIRRSLRLVEVTGDPLSYVGDLSETFFGQIFDGVTAFIKLFCKSSRIHERRAQKSGKSAGYYQICQGVRDCGTAPFCRVVVWVNQEIDYYVVLMGRQVRAVTMGPQVKKSGREGSASGSWVSSGEESGFRLGPVSSSLFSIVSLMLEEGFAAAAKLNAVGLPVSVQLASRLVPDVAFFLSSYVDSVKENLVEAIRKDAFISVECKLVRPEALCDCTLEEDETNARKAQLTSSAHILVLEARDILDYALVLLEPPPPEDDAFGLAGTGVGDTGAGEVEASAAFGGAGAGVADGAGGQGEEAQLECYYTRDEFLELEPVIVTSLDTLLRAYLKETLACMRARRDELSSNQATAVMNNITAIGGRYIPLLAAWCAELLPEIAQEEEVTSLRELKSEFQRSSQNLLRAREIASSSSAAASASKLPHAGGAPPATSSAARRSPDAPLLSTGGTLPRKELSRRSDSSSGGGSGKSAAPAAAGGAGRAANATVREDVPSLKQTLSMRASASANTGAHSGANANASPYSSSTAVATAAAKINTSFTSKPAFSPPSSASYSSQPQRLPSSSKAVSPATSSSTTATTASSRAPSQAPASNPAPTSALAAPSYTHYRRPSQIIAAQGGTLGSGMSRKLSGATGGGKSTSMSMPMSPSAQAEAVAKAATAAAANAAAASAGTVRSPPPSGPRASGEGVTKRPTMTLKAAREAREAKAKAAADAKAAREART